MLVCMCMGAALHVLDSVQVRRQAFEFVRVRVGRHMRVRGCAHVHTYMRAYMRV